MIAVALRVYSMQHYVGVNSNGFNAEPLYGDEAAYYELGRNVYLGEGPVEYVVWDLWAHNEVPHLHSFWPPFFAYLIGALFYIFGESIFVIRLFAFIISLLTVILTYYIGSKIYDNKIGLIAMFLIAINPFHIFHSGLIMIENLFTFFVLLFIFFAYKSFYHGKLIYWILLGLSLGIATITRYFGFLLLIGLMIIIFIRRKNIKISYALISLIIFLFVILPVGIQTYKNFGSPFYSTSTYMKYVDHRVSYYEPNPPSLEKYLSRPIGELVYERLYGVGRVIVLFPQIITPIIFALLFLSLIFIDRFSKFVLTFFVIFYFFIILSIGPGYLIGERYLIYFVPSLLIIAAYSMKSLVDKDNRHIKHAVVAMLIFTFLFSSARIINFFDEYPTPEQRNILGFNDKDIYEMSLWIKRNTHKDDVMMSDSFSISRFFFDRRIVNNPYPRIISMNLNDYSEEAKTIHIDQAKKFNVSYLMITPRSGDREEILYGFSEFEPELIKNISGVYLYKLDKSK